jgi:hypothetical protein
LPEPVSRDEGDDHSRGSDVPELADSFSYRGWTSGDERSSGTRKKFER